VARQQAVQQARLEALRVGQKVRDLVEWKQVHQRDLRPQMKPNQMVMLAAVVVGRMATDSVGKADRMLWQGQGQTADQKVKPAAVKAGQRVQALVLVDLKAARSLLLIGSVQPV
jgi:hypothetical protein